MGNNIYTRKSSEQRRIFTHSKPTLETLKKCEICSKLTIKTPDRFSTVFIVDFGHILYLFLVFKLLTINKSVFVESIYKRWNNKLLQSLKKTVAQSRVVVPKKVVFFSSVTVFNRRQKFVSENSISLLHKGSCSQPCPNGYCIFQKSTWDHKLHIYNVFDKYFYLRGIVTSKEHLQPYIWAVPSLFQEATYPQAVI